MMDVSILLEGVISLSAVITDINNRYEAKRNNDSVIEGELQQFLNQIGRYADLLSQQSDHVLRNSCATASAFDDLKNVLEEAQSEAKKIREMGFFRSVWDSNRIGRTIQALRERVMFAFQIYLTIATLNVSLEGKREQEEYNRAMSDANRALWARYENTISMAAAATQKEMMEVRKDLKLVTELLVKKMEQEERRIAADELRNIIAVAQTSVDSEKFLADILAALDSPPSSWASISSAAEEEVEAEVEEDVDQDWYHDPITYEMMCDPVKATDGHTYDRWTIIKNPSGMARSPFHSDEAAGNRAFQIAADDLDVRSRLFRKFPEQEARFRQEREKYRREALAAATSAFTEYLENDGSGEEARKEALRMLESVLQWDMNDSQCAAIRSQLLDSLTAPRGATGSELDGALTLSGRHRYNHHHLHHHIVIRSDAPAAAAETTSGGELRRENDDYDGGEASDGMYFLQFPRSQRPASSIQVHRNSTEDLCFLAFPRLA